MSNEIKNLSTVGLVGNIANNFYREASLLNNSNEIKFTCFGTLYEQMPNTELPESDPLFSNKDNVDFFVSMKPFLGIPFWALFLPRFLISLLPQIQHNILSQLDQLDLKVFSGPEIILAPKLRGPYIIRPTGSDLTVSPSLSYKDYLLLQRKTCSRVKERILWNLMRHLYRKSYRKAKFISICCETPYLLAIKKLKFPKQKICHAIPLTINMEGFIRKNVFSHLIPSKIKENDFLIFMPSRIMISNTNVHIQTGQWKASDVAIQGFKIFWDNLSTVDKEKVWLLIPDRTLSNELELAKHITSTSSIRERIVWLKGSAQNGLTREEMIPLYSMSSATLDDFGVGWYGSVVLESMACETPVITYLSEENMHHHGYPPILNAKTADDIAECLTSLFANPDNRKVVGINSRNWVATYHSPERVKSIYKLLLSEIYAKK